MPMLTIAPSAQWNGVPGSGFGGANSAAPTDPVRSTAKPTLNPLFVPFQVVDGGAQEQFVLGFESFANGLKGGSAFGVSHVRIWCEGNYVDVPEESFHHFLDVNGQAADWFGFNAALDVSATLALSSTGTVEIYAESFPNDPTMQRRVRGPFHLHPRSGLLAAPWGGPAIYDHVIELAPSQPESSPTRFKTIAAALNYCGNPMTRKFHPLIWNSESGDYPADQAAAASIVDNTLFFTTWTSGPGVTARIVRGAQAGVSLRYDGIRLAGMGMTFDRAVMSSTFGLAWICRSQSRCMLWLDGINVTTSVPAGGSGFGAGALLYGQPGSANYFGVGNSPATTPTNWFATECMFTQMASGGINGFSLQRGGSMSGIGGSAIQGVGSPDATSGGMRKDAVVHNVRVENVGSMLAGIRTYKEAATITYSGLQPGMGWAKEGVNGAPGNLWAVQAFVASLTANTLTVTAAPPNVTLQVGSLIWSPAGINNTGDPILRTITSLGTGSGGVGTYTLGGATQQTPTGSVAFWAGQLSAPIISGGAANTLVPDLATYVNANWPDWSMTSIATNDRAAKYITKEGDPNVDPANAVYPQALSPGQPSTIQTIIDSHSDVVPMSSANYENIRLDRLTIVGTAHAASLSSGDTTQRRDVWLTRVSSQDVSSTYPPYGNGQPSYINSQDSHAGWKWSSFYGSGSFFGGSYNSDQYCRYSYISFESFGYYLGNIRISNTIDHVSLRTGSTSALGAMDSIQQNGAPATELYLDPAAGDLHPRLSLRLPNGEFAGRWTYAENGIC